MAFSALDIFNALIPKDIWSRRLVADVPFGSHPRQRLDIYGPRGHDDNARPVVVFLYGGSWESGDKRSYGFVGRALASLGYVVVIADYRILPEIEYPVFLEDCAAAVSWTSHNINRFGGDFTRVALVGHSAGAYNAAMLALAPDLIADKEIRLSIKGMAGLSGPYDFYPFDGAISRRVFGQVAEPEQTQPIHYVEPDAPPLWLATGDRDRLVLPRNSDALARAMYEAGGDAESCHYPGLGHAGTLLALSLPLRFRAPIFSDLGAFLASIFAR